MKLTAMERDVLEQNLNSLKEQISIYERLLKTKENKGCTLRLKDNEKQQAISTIESMLNNYKYQIKKVYDKTNMTKDDRVLVDIYDKLFK